MLYPDTSIPAFSPILAQAGTAVPTAAPLPATTTTQPSVTGNMPPDSEVGHLMAWWLVAVLIFIAGVQLWIIWRFFNELRKQTLLLEKGIGLLEKATSPRPKQ